MTSLAKWQDSKSLEPIWASSYIYMWASKDPLGELSQTLTRTSEFIFIAHYVGTLFCNFIIILALKIKFLLYEQIIFTYRRSVFIFVCLEAHVMNSSCINLIFVFHFNILSQVHVLSLNCHILATCHHCFVNIWFLTMYLVIDSNCTHFELMENLPELVYSYKVLKWFRKFYIL